MTWFANALILVGMYLNGHKNRSCFLFGAAGESVWAVTSGLEGRWDLSSICAVFVVMAVRNYFKWGRQ